MTIATLLLTCLAFVLVGRRDVPAMLTAISMAAVVCIASSNGGTTSQDLKTGYPVGSTPKYQQYAILFGALTSAVTTVARLRALVTVADTGSVREAARRLTVTESAVSAALSALAREVRVPLVERDGRGLRLTGPGQAYAGYARAILGLHDEGLAAAVQVVLDARGLK